jgi:hypothetical protein
MWRQCRDWLLVGAIPEDDGSHLDRKDRTVIESKDDMADRGVASSAERLALS